MGITPQDIDAKAALARARAEADAITGRAEVEAAAVEARARAEADVIVARARVEAAEMRAQGEHTRQHARDLLDDARRRADALLAEAEEVRRSADGTLERLVAARRELESTIDQLATSPNTLVDLTETLHSTEEVAAVPESDPLDLDALSDRRVVPLGAPARTPAGVSASAEPPMGAQMAAGTDDGDVNDPVSRMVRSAIGRASRAAADAPEWSDRPSEQREALRANGRDLG